MPTVIFERNRRAQSLSAVPDANVVVPAFEGGALVDVCDAHMAPVPFSCKSASCGTCRIDVLEGAENLFPPADEEADLLEILAASPHQRLACQVQLRPGPGTLRVRPVEDD